MDKVKITNRSGSFVGYVIDEMNLKRDFAPNESKMVLTEELTKLSYQPGGQELIDAYFLIHDKDLAMEVSPLKAQEPEYNMTDVEVTALLKAQNNIDEFLDVLDFAPEGVLDLIKTLSVSLPLTDTQKMEAIKEKLGFNVQTAIMIRRENEQSKAAPAKRRVAATETTTTAPVTPKYRRVEPK